MKLIFEGKNIDEIVEQMVEMVNTHFMEDGPAEDLTPAKEPELVIQAEEPESETEEEPIAKKRGRPAKAPVEELPPLPAKAAKPAKGDAKKAADPFAANAVELRSKTLADLQTAYANGKHVEVLGLLAKFGKGAKSFRELGPDAFAPIREAIDAGALA